MPMPSFAEPVLQAKLIEAGGRSFSIPVSLDRMAYRERISVKAVSIMPTEFGTFR
jgi:hypothetical protein